MEAKYKLPRHKMTHCGCPDVATACARFQSTGINPWSGRPLTAGKSSRYNQVAEYCTSQGVNVPSVPVSKPPPRKKARKAPKKAKSVVVETPPASPAPIEAPMTPPATPESPIAPLIEAAADTIMQESGVDMIQELANAATTALANEAKAKQEEAAAKIRLQQNRKDMIKALAKWAEPQWKEARTINILIHLRIAMEEEKEKMEAAALESAKQKQLAAAITDMTDVVASEVQQAPAGSLSRAPSIAKLPEVAAQEKMQEKVDDVIEKVQDDAVLKRGTFESKGKKWRLEVRSSSIGEAGYGLFTLDPIPADTIICPYSGNGMKVISHEEFAKQNQLTGYAVELSQDWVLDIDGIDDMASKPFGIFANRASSGDKNSAKLTKYKDPSGTWGVNLKTGKSKVKAGSEIFTAYGGKYKIPDRIPPVFAHLPTNSDASCHMVRNFFFHPPPLSIFFF